MIKVGQFMSSRLDVLPPEITQGARGAAGRGRRRAVRAAIRARAEAELGDAARARVLLRSIATPLAAASLGQAHRATLPRMPTPTHSAATMRRQGAAARTSRPSSRSISRRCAAWAAGCSRVRRSPIASTCRRWSRSSRPRASRRSTTCTRPRTPRRFAPTSPTSRGSHVPRVVWERTHAARADAARTSPRSRSTTSTRSRAAGYRPRGGRASSSRRVMFDQLFEDGFFHADPHPGNLFVTPLEGVDAEGKPTLAADVHRLRDDGRRAREPTRRGLREVLIAAASRDGQGHGRRRSARSACCCRRRTPQSSSGR